MTVAALVRRAGVRSFGMLVALSTANLVSAVFNTVSGDYGTALFNFVVAFWLASMIPASYRDAVAP